MQLHRFRAMANDQAFITLMTCEVNLKNVYGALSAFTRTGRFDGQPLLLCQSGLKTCSTFYVLCSTLKTKPCIAVIPCIQKQFSCRNRAGMWPTRRRQIPERLKTSFVHNGLADMRRDIKKTSTVFGRNSFRKNMGWNCLWQGKPVSKKIDVSAI